MADAVIRAQQVQTTPAGYTVPDAQQILVRSVRAVIDGTGAAGAFTPVLQLKDPTGAIVWQAPGDATIAAGASADVSWFPRVAAAAKASAPGAISWAYLACNGAATNCAGNAITEVIADATTFYTNDAATFASGALAAPANTGIIYKKNGHYLVMVNMNTDVSPGVDQWQLQLSRGGGTISEMFAGKSGTSSAVASIASELATTLIAVESVATGFNAAPTAAEAWAVNVFTATAVSIELEAIFVMLLDTTDQELI